MSPFSERWQKWVCDNHLYWKYQLRIQNAVTEGTYKGLICVFSLTRSIASPSIYYKLMSKIIDPNIFYCLEDLMYLNI